MKDLKALKEDSKSYFDRYPKESVFYATPDGQFFIGKNRNLAMKHAANFKGKYYTIQRSDISTSSKVAGKSTEPSKDWKVDEIKEYLNSREIPFDDKLKKKDDLLVLIYPEGDPSKDWTVDEIKAYMKAKEIEFTSEDLEADLLAKIEAVGKDS